MTLNRWCVVPVAFFCVLNSGISWAAQLTVDTVIAPAESREYLHHDEVVLQAGFWAKAGATVTARIQKTVLQLIEERPTPRTPGFIAPYDTGDRGVTVQIGKNVTLPNPSNYYALTKIEIREMHNNPCYLRLWGGLLDQRFVRPTRDRVLAEYQLDQCNFASSDEFTTMGPGGDQLLVGFGVSANKYLRAVTACHDPASDDGWEIKGLEVKAGRPAFDGNTWIMEPLSDSDRAKHPNCPDKPGQTSFDFPGLQDDMKGWAGLSCPSPNSLFIGVNLSVHKDKRFSDLSPICRLIQEREGPFPVKDATDY